MKNVWRVSNHRCERCLGSLSMSTWMGARIGVYPKGSVERMIDHMSVPMSLSQTIEDAIMFGHVKELDEVLELIKDDSDFSEELRYGIEALRYFRSHYGRDGTMKPNVKLQMQQITVMESAWSAELLDMLRQGELVAEKRA